MPPKKTSPTGRRKTAAGSAEPRTPRRPKASADKAPRRAAARTRAEVETSASAAPTIEDYATAALDHPAFATSPLGVLLGVAQDEAMPIALRVQAAKAALPFVHRRRAGEKPEPTAEETPSYERELERLLAIPDDDEESDAEAANEPDPTDDAADDDEAAEESEPTS